MGVAPAPGTAEWAAKVTASKVAAILGLSPWESPYSMWLKMRGDIPADDGSNQAAKSRGHYLEDGIIRWWADQHPARDIEETQPSALLDDWGAATPDATIAKVQALPGLNAVVIKDYEQARAHAKKLSGLSAAQRKSATAQAALWGVPFVLKDLGVSMSNPAEVMAMFRTALKRYPRGASTGH